MTLKLLESPPVGTTAGAVPTVQADGTIVYVVPAAGATINDTTTTSTTQVWSAKKTSDAIAAITEPTISDASTSAKGVLQLSGDLAGTASAPTLIPVGTAGTYGSATAVPVVTTDAKGRVTNVTTVPFSGFFFYNGTDWGAYPTDQPCVFWSIGYTGVTGPANAADDSVWFYSS